MKRSKEGRKMDRSKLCLLCFMANKFMIRLREIRFIILVIRKKSWIFQRTLLKIELLGPKIWFLIHIYRSMGQLISF